MRAHAQTKTIAEQMAEKINAKLGYRPPVEEEKEEETPAFGESFKRYEVDLEINDFPQTARWRVTSRVSQFIATCANLCNRTYTVCWSCMTIVVEWVFKN